MNKEQTKLGAAVFINHVYSRFPCFISTLAPMSNLLLNIYVGFFAHSVAFRNTHYATLFFNALTSSIVLSTVMFS